MAIKKFHLMIHYDYTFAQHLRVNLISFLCYMYIVLDSTDKLCNVKVILVFKLLQYINELNFSTSVKVIHYNYLILLVFAGA